MAVMTISRRTCRHDVRPRFGRSVGCGGWLNVLLLLLVTFATLLPQVSGQRAIVSLGKRLKNHFNKRGKNANGQQQKQPRFLQQGEQKEVKPKSAVADIGGKSNDSDHVNDMDALNIWWRLERFATSPLLPSYLVSTIVATFLALILQYWHRRTSRRQRGNISHHGRKNVTIIHHVADDDIVVQDDRVVAVKGLSQVDIAFEGLQLVLHKKKDFVNILDGSIRGRARPGRLLAIMGPSGAGKSTVLHALAGRIKASSKLQLYGERYINGIALAEDSMIPAAFIGQDVSFFPYMTVRETLAFRVELKLGSLISKKGRAQVVNDLLEQMGLTRAADTIVGDSDKVRGISGGERKRLSIAVEMISSPSTICLDEPTSGLDSTAATALVQTLRDLANAGKTVIAVIHQPNQHVFAKFDDVLLVSEGKQMYFGPRQDVRSYFEVHGCKAEDEMGTAEHILDCISRAPIGDETDDDVNERMERLATIAREAKIKLGRLVTQTKLDADNQHANGIGAPSMINGAVQQLHRFTAASVGGPKANLFVQFRLLLKRSLREITRAKVTILLKLVQQVSTALIYGGIYSLGTNQASIQDRFGLLSLIAIGSMNMGLAQTIRSFPREKAIVSNEIASNMYRTLPYFIGKAMSELPMVGVFNGIFGVVVYKLTGLSTLPGKMMNFLGLLFTHGVLSQAAGLFIGAISPNSDVALAMFPALVVLNIIFDGKNIAEESIPRLLRWIPKVGLIRWGFEGLCVNEFSGLQFDATGGSGGGRYRGPVAKTGMDALARFGLGSRSLADVVQAQLYIATTCWVLSYIGLTLTRQRFLVMKKEVAPTPPPV